MLTPVWWGIVGLLRVVIWFIMKVISKLLTSKMAGVLQIIINDAQSAFMKGWSMIKNIHLVHELLKQYGQKKISPDASKGRPKEDL